MLLVVPSAIAKIDSAHERHRLIYHNTLFVVCPHEHARYGIIRMSEHFNIRIFPFLSEHIFRSRVIKREYKRELFVQQNVDLDALF